MMNPSVPQIDPCLTVCIPCFKEGELLRSALESLTQQTFEKWEAIVVNDASSDEETNNICRSISDSRIRVIWRSENGGLSSARNDAVASARTDWIVPLDGDDLLPPHALAVVARTIVDNPTARFIFGKFTAFGYYEETVDPFAFRAPDILSTQPFGGCSPFHREVWKNVGGFDQALSWGNQDWDFWVGAVGQGFSWVYVPEIIYLYRTRRGTMCQSYEMRWPEISEYIYRKHAYFFDRFGARRQFLAKGYRRGAIAAHESGHCRAAAHWSAKAIWLGDASRYMLSVLAKNIIRIMTKNDCCLT